MAEDEYVQMMYFFRSFFKEILGEAMGLMGRKGVLAILGVASRKFAQSKLGNYQIAQKNYDVAIKMLLNLGRPKLQDDGAIITLKICPFRTRPSFNKPYLEEDVFCSICLGFINGIGVFFNKGPKVLIESRIRKAKMCKFISRDILNTYLLEKSKKIEKKCG